MSSVDVNKETLGFQSETKALLDLVIHSLYSHPEIFLRELVSNASDAAEKLRFEALGNDGLYEGDSELNIQVEYSEQQKTITVRDNGIGMSREEMIGNLGTLARSGTREFFKNLTGDKQQDTQLIGQFGVGFYSAFIVAGKVTVTSRRAGQPAEQGVRWESDGLGEYTVQGVLRKKRGTEVVLHLKDEFKDYLNGWRLRDIIRRYSDHIALPIRMPEEGKDKTGWETVNRATALWARNKKEVTAGDYDEFYKHIAHDFEKPLAHVHTRTEGRLEYTTLFYIPSHAPFDLWDREARHGVKLYVRRIFIMDDAEQLLPRYLRFVRGIVDSNDLPLNVSRELLQRNKTIDTIRAASVKKILGLIESLAGREDYKTLWKEFGRVLKEGIAEDADNRETLAGLLRYESTLHPGEGQTVALSDYVSRMPEAQDAIYYLAANDAATARSSPHLEVFRKKGIEVLLMSDPVDEWVVMHLTEFKGRPLKSVSKGDLDLGRLETEEEKKERQGETRELKDLLGRLRKTLDNETKDVRVTRRLTDSPACLVADSQDMGGNLERLLKAVGQNIAAAKPILEINPEHALIKHLGKIEDETRFGDWARILFDQALLAEGGRLSDPAGFVRRLNAMFATMAS
ncbi:MAG TPA: molecular chaperone HtpG [Gammaproteobacteria bacterium]|nr:molecular chaperone HtpG [Gammaproteobacteria bacterium]